jgi:hypothetical protein
MRVSMVCDLAVQLRLRSASSFTRKKIWIECEPQTEKTSKGVTIEKKVDWGDDLVLSWGYSWRIKDWIDPDSTGILLRVKNSPFLAGGGDMQIGKFKPELLLRIYYYANIPLLKHESNLILSICIIFQKNKELVIIMPSSLCVKLLYWCKGTHSNTWRVDWYREFNKCKTFGSTNTVHYSQ